MREKSFAVWILGVSCLVLVLVALPVAYGEAGAAFVFFATTTRTLKGGIPESSISSG